MKLKIKVLSTQLFIISVFCQKIQSFVEMHTLSAGNLPAQYFAGNSEMGVDAESKLWYYICC